MDLCVWTRNKATVHRVGLWTRNPTKVVCGKITSKQMMYCFFCKTGHVATVPLEHSRTVNSEWYTTICMPKVFGEIRKSNKRRRIIVHYGNASSHIGSAFLTGQNVELMGHPPYSPDLAPNEFFLFPHIKKKKCSTILVARRCCWSVQKPCFGGVSIEVEKVLRQVVWAHAIVYESCWRILWKTIKPCLMINISVIRPEMYRTTLVIPL